MGAMPRRIFCLLVGTLTYVLALTMSVAADPQDGGGPEGWVLPPTQGRHRTRNR